MVQLLQEFQPLHLRQGSGVWVNSVPGPQLTDRAGESTAHGRLPPEPAPVWTVRQLEWGGPEGRVCISLHPEFFHFLHCLLLVNPWAVIPKVRLGGVFQALRKLPFLGLLFWYRK